MKPMVDSKLTIGAIIRDQIIPSDISVTEAAKKLGVSRPTLSKLLNGKASLSQKMANRLQEVFGIDATELLSMQTDLISGNEIHPHQLRGMAHNVPGYPVIKALDIEKWGARDMEARNLLPVLVRRLIQETSRNLQKVDFPGYDNAQRHGFDGEVMAEFATLNVPKGRSIWELSVQNNPKGKAENDYKARLNNLSESERAKASFVFVTTYNWKGKDTWVSKKNETGEWNDVRVYDASDLEQWLETTFFVRIWLAEKMGESVRGIRSLETCWNKWSHATAPRLTCGLFAPHIQGYKNTFLNWLQNPPERPFIIASDSRLESIAFIACLLKEKEIRTTISDNALVFESVDSLDVLNRMSDRFIAIIADDKIEHQVADAYRKHYCIIVRPKNIPSKTPDILIDTLGRYSLEKALLEMGIERHRVDLVIRESGLSPTVLRRRLSAIPAIQKPPWADGSDRARKLIPLSLIGSWNTEFDADRKILSMLAEISYRDIEISIADLYQLDESPIWCIGKHCGVRSRVDVLFEVSPMITEGDLTRFLEIAENVFSVSKTSIESTENNQESPPYSSNIRNHSAALQSGIRDTLILLSLHGKGLFLNRLGINIQDQIAGLIKRLLTPFSEELLWFRYPDFPDFAEAAPEVFLNILQEDLQQSESILRSLLEKTTGDVFSYSLRPDILWALERLAWHKDHFPDVINILAKLSEIPIHDNLGNTPIKSLSAIFHSWLPQTSVSVKDRITVLESLCQRFPLIGWKICIRQMDYRNDHAGESTRPRWRSVESVEPVDQSEIMEFKRKVQEITLHWPNHDERTLSDLLMCLFRVDKNIQIQILKCVKHWQTNTNDSKCRAKIREAIGDLLYSIAGNSYTWIESDVCEMAYDIFKDLLPNDSYERYAILFGVGKDYFPIAKLDDPSIDRKHWLKQVPLLQEKVITQIWLSDGIDGIVKLLSKSSTGYKLGELTAHQKMTPQKVADAIHDCLLTDIVSTQKINKFLNGFFSSLDDNLLIESMPPLLKKCSNEEIEHILHYLPFRTQILPILDQLPKQIRDQLLRNMNIPLKEYSATEACTLIDHLMDVGRYWDALYALRADFDKVNTQDLKRLLEAIADQNPCIPRFSDHHSYYLSKAIKSLGKRKGITIDELAQLEFGFVDVLVPDECKVPFLEKQFSDSPSRFIHYLLILKNRRTNHQDMDTQNVNDENIHQVQVVRAYRLFQVLNRLPGQSELGDIDVKVLINWVTDVRDLATDHDCIESCDQVLGDWLSKASAFDQNTEWPDRVICEVLENIRTESIRYGFKIGVLNARGVAVRLPYEGGDQERNLVDQFKIWAEGCKIEFPFVSKILMDISERYEKDATWVNQRAKSDMYLDL